MELFILHFIYNVYVLIENLVQMQDYVLSQFGSLTKIINISSHIEITN